MTQPNHTGTRIPPTATGRLLQALGQDAAHQHRVLQRVFHCCLIQLQGDLGER